jgi:hypothetical protein
MSTPYEAVAVIAPILALAVLYVALPVFAATYRRFRGPRTVICPETGNAAVIRLDARQAALNATLGSPPDLQIADCQHWPKRQHCDRSCLGEVRRATAG